jgi:hypothetical protein
MKRKILTALFLIMVSLAAFGQSTQRQPPIIGCAGLFWGASVEDYQRVYPQSKESSRLSQPGEGIRVFTQEAIRYGGLDSMELHFYHDRLFKVSIVYAKRDHEAVDYLFNDFQSTYGKFDTSTARSGQGMSIQDFTRNYREDLSIQFSVIEEYGMNDITVAFIFLDPGVSL